MQRLRTWQLFALCVLVWGTTWHAITWQLDDIGPEFGVAVRFALAGALVLALAAWRGDALRFGIGDHVAFAVQGVFLYGLAYVCVYHAERHVASGLVALGYSAAPLTSGIGAAILFNAVLGKRFIAGGVLGILGIALVFWPELTGPAAGGRGTLGAAFTVAAVALSTIGSLAASRNRSRGVGLLPAMGYGMLYGAAAALVVTLAVGGRIGTPASWPNWVALGWLAVAGSVIAFACFLTLQDRLGVGPAGTVGVMTPLVALVVSVAFEGFRPGLLTAIGVAVAVAGNVLMLWPKAEPDAPAAQPSPATGRGGQISGAAGGE